VPSCPSRTTAATDQRPPACIPGTRRRTLVCRRSLSGRSQKTFPHYIPIIAPGRRIRSTHLVHELERPALILDRIHPQPPLLASPRHECRLHRRAHNERRLATHSLKVADGHGEGRLVLVQFKSRK
jgi:hypothetical protein